MQKSSIDRRRKGTALYRRARTLNKLKDDELVGETEEEKRMRRGVRDRGGGTGWNRERGGKEGVE